MSGSKFLTFSLISLIVFSFISFGGCATPQEQAAWEAETDEPVTPEEMRMNMMKAGAGQRKGLQGRILR